ncbi:hypothetical protein PGIGA_G00066730 [Pangasianodon gigas]|uniref:Uncharacterized protein n=1 Tax=Pangasianodon gigas TaxID=30993 RepID=A0ACC5X6L7_PANGG|nr:hypothetical protein [Pangasianodon gigas]
MEPDVVFCCCSPSSSRFDVLCILRCFSAHHMIKFQWDVRNCCVVAFTETWLDATVPDSGVSLPGFPIHRQERITDSGAPPRCVLSPFLYSLFIHDSVTKHSSNIIFKFAVTTTILGLITDGDETAYRDEMEVLQESRMMIPDCHRRLAMAHADLQQLLEMGVDLEESEEYKEARSVLDSVKLEG